MGYNSECVTPDTEGTPMTDTASPTSDRQANGRFAPGHAGGRPLGSRNRVSRKVIVEILRDFDAHKQVLLDRLRSSYTPSYFNTLARMMPHMAQIEVSEFEDYSDAQAARVVDRLRKALAVTAQPRDALAEFEAILASEGETAGDFAGPGPR